MSGSEPSKPTEGLRDLPSSALENLEMLANLADREQAAISGVRSFVERITASLGSVWFLAFCIAFTGFWVIANILGQRAGWHHVDGPPFALLQGIVGATALLLTIAVLMRQNRMAQLAEHRAHLDLQINLLTEQKATKILQIVDELQRELTARRRYPDTQTEEMTKPVDANAILHAIKHQKGDR